MAIKSAQELMFEYGFLKKGSEHASKGREERTKLLKEASPDDHKKLLEQVDEEIVETADGYFTGSGYPSSQAIERLVYESPNNSIEENYFWVLEHLRQDRGFHDIIKIIDIYSSSEASAFWGNQQQRISAQQNQASGLLANMGKMVHDLFETVREVRIIDERLEAYNSWEYKENGITKHSDSADVTLKSIFTDLVEGGTKNPQSVFGLQQTVGFTILPTLFFNTKVYSERELDQTIKDMDQNESVKQLLRRKLYQFLLWKKHTHKELENRRIFSIRYLNQHWNVIKLYMNWVKPYLRNLRALQMEHKEGDPDLISSFDQNLTEVELLAKHKPQNGVYPVIIANFQFRTRPEMSIRREAYHLGPAHMGRLEMTFRAYGWNEEQIENYLAMKRKEEIVLLGLLDEHLSDIMEVMSEEFEKYLDEYKKILPQKAEDKPEKKILKKEVANTFEPFTAIFGGFAELATALIPIPKRKKKDKGKPMGPDFKSAAEKAAGEMFLTYHIYKKAKQMLTW